MNNKLIFLPVLAHFLLIFMLYIYLGIVKTRAAKDSNFDRQAASLNSKAWPNDVLKVSNNLTNQFESPILFYVLSILYYLSDDVGNVLLSIMSLYVLSRYVHTYIHITSNYVPHRFQVFRAGILLLLGLTLGLAVTLLSA